MINELMIVVMNTVNVGGGYVVSAWEYCTWYLRNLLS